MPLPTVPCHLAGALLAVAAITFAGCGAQDAIPTPSSPAEAIEQASDLSQRAVVTSDRLMRKACPELRRGHEDDLTQQQAKRCLRRGWEMYRDELRKHGYDPENVARRIEGQ